MAHTDQLWSIVEDQRRRIAAFLDTLADGEWSRASLCDGWTIKDVAAHLALVPQAPSLWQMLPMIVAARGSFNRLNQDVARRYSGRHSTDELVSQLRDQAAVRDLPAVTSVENLAMDIVVHGQDMALPLRRELPVPADAALNALERAWTMGWPFHARRRLADFRLTATDADWSVGEGALVSGTTVALLLLVTGRTTVALPLLGGAGVAGLRSAAEPQPQRKRS